jgi:hypothetical protein
MSLTSFRFEAHVTKDDYTFLGVSYQMLTPGGNVLNKRNHKIHILRRI